MRERVAHVEGARQRRKVYDLTDAGKLRAIQLKTRTEMETVPIREPTRLREATIAQVIRESVPHVSVLDVLRHVTYGGAVDVARLASPMGTRFVEMISEAPSLKRFVGRRAELAAVMGEPDGSRVCIVRGLAGIGKSSLASKACELLRGRRNLFWHRIRPWDTPANVLGHLGRFLSSLGKPGLGSILERGDSQRAPDVLCADLPETNVFLVFDDGHEASPQVRNVLRLLLEALRVSAEARMVVLTRQTLPFYDRRSVALEGLVREVELEGLDASDFESLAPEEREEWVGLARRLEGHPLFIELAQSAPPAPGGSSGLTEVTQFIEEEIYGQLSAPERRMMKLASLYRVPVPPEALFWDPELTHDILMSLRQRSLIRHTGGGFELHDTIRSFFASVLTPEENRMMSKFASESLRQLCNIKKSSGDIGAAVNYLSNAERLFVPASERTAMLEQLGDLQGRLGDTPAQIVAYKEARKLTDERQEAARLHRKVADALVRMGDMAAALSEADLALQTLGQRPGPERGWIHMAKCDAAWPSNMNQSREHAKVALEVFGRAESVVGQVRSLLALGHLEHDASDGSAVLARDYMEAAMGLAESLGDDKLVALGHIKLAWLQSLRFSDIAEAARHLCAVEHMPAAMEDLVLRCSFLEAQGFFLANHTTDYAKAAAIFSVCIRTARAIHLSFVGTHARYGRALCLLRQGLLIEARREFEDVISEWGSAGTHMVVMAFHGLALCCALQDDRQGFLQVARRLDDPAYGQALMSQAVFAKIIRGMYLLVEGRDPESRRTFEEAIQAAETPPRSIAEAGSGAYTEVDWASASYARVPHFAHLYYGIALRVMGDDQRGTGHIERALEISSLKGLSVAVYLPDYAKGLLDVLTRWRPHREAAD